MSPFHFGESEKVDGNHKRYKATNRDKKVVSPYDVNTKAALKLSRMHRLMTSKHLILLTSTSIKS